MLLPLLHHHHHAPTSCRAQTPGRRRFTEAPSGEQMVAPVDTSDMDRIRLVEEIRSLESDLEYMNEKSQKLEVRLSRLARCSPACLHPSRAVSHGYGAWLCEPVGTKPPRAMSQVH